MTKLRKLINRYNSVDCIRRKFHSLRAEHTLVYKLDKIKNFPWSDIKSTIQCRTISELEFILRDLNEMIFEDEPHELRHFDISNIEFYYRGCYTLNEIYIAITVSLRHEIYCTLNINNPLSKHGDMDDLDIFMRRSAPQDVSRRVRTVLKLIEPPDKIRICNISTVYLSRVTCEFYRLHEQGYLSYFHISNCKNKLD
jgi:hypothetical protein